MEKVEITENTTDQMNEKELDELNQILLNTQEQCQMVEHLIKNQIEVKDELINRLHKELEYYKQNQAERFTDQLMKAVIKVRKDMVKQMNAEKWEELSADQMRRVYQYTMEDLTDLLQQQNIDPFTTNEGEYFDASKHQIFKLEDTTDVMLDKTIKQSVSEGYVKGDKVLIAERVIVYQCK